MELNGKVKHVVDELGFLTCHTCNESKPYAEAFRAGTKKCRDCNKARDKAKFEAENTKGVRFCKRCAQDKPVTDFSPGNTQCRPCKAAYTLTKTRNAQLPPEQQVELTIIGHAPKRERKFDADGNRWCWKCESFTSPDLFRHERTLCDPCSLLVQKERRRELRDEAIARGLPPRKNARQESGPKTCTICGETKPFELFKMSCYQCNLCRSSAYREKYWSAPDEYRAMFRGRYAADAERQRARVIAYWAANPETRHKVRKNWNDANPGKTRAQAHRRRARVRQAEGDADYAGIMSRIDYYGHKCWMCDYHVVSAIDHVKALCNGGSNWPSNLRPACWECNSQKGGWERNRPLTPTELHQLPARMREERAKSSKPRRAIKTVYTRRKIDGGFARP